VPAAFVVSSLVSLTGLLVALVAVRPDVPRSREAGPSKGSARAAFGVAGLRWLMVLFMVGDGGMQGLRPLIPVMISERLSDPAAVAATTGLCATLATAGTVVSALVVGRLSRRIAPRSVLLVTLPVATAVAALLPYATDIPPMLGAWLLLGLASGATAPAIFAWAGRVAPAGGGAYALLAIASMLAYALGPALLGEVSVYGLDWPFRVGAALTAGAVVFIVFSSPRRVDEPLATAENRYA
jgi:MFS family permease